jgi:hypothetical protein
MTGVQTHTARDQQVIASEVKGDCEQSQAIQNRRLALL